MCLFFLSFGKMGYQCRAMPKHSCHISIFSDLEIFVLFGALENMRHMPFGPVPCICSLHLCIFYSFVHCTRVRNNQESRWALAYPFARSLAPLTHSLAPPCLLRSRAPLRLLTHSLRARGNASD